MMGPGAGSGGGSWRISANALWLSEARMATACCFSADENCGFTPCTAISQRCFDRAESFVKRTQARTGGGAAGVDAAPSIPSGAPPLAISAASGSGSSLDGFVSGLANTDSSHRSEVMECSRLLGKLALLKMDQLIGQ